MKTEEEIKDQIKRIDNHIADLKKHNSNIGCALYESAKKILEWVLED